MHQFYVCPDAMRRLLSRLASVVREHQAPRPDGQVPGGRYPMAPVNRWALAHSPIQTGP